MYSEYCKCALERIPCLVDITTRPLDFFHSVRFLGILLSLYFEGSFLRNLHSFKVLKNFIVVKEIKVLNFVHLKKGM